MCDIVRDSNDEEEMEDDDDDKKSMSHVECPCPVLSRIKLSIFRSPLSRVVTSMHVTPAFPDTGVSLIVSATLLIKFKLEPHGPGMGSNY
jgi:hypothetical protein